MTIPEALQLAMEHHQAGRLAPAEGLYRAILAQQPANADALHLLGVLAYQSRRFPAAEDLIRKAIAISPSSDSYYSNLGLVLTAMNRFNDAMVVYKQAQVLAPDSPETKNNYGNVLFQQGKLDEAMKLYQEALALRPDFADALLNIGNVLDAQGRGQDAIDAYRQALAVRPNYTNALNNLANALYHTQQLEESVKVYRQALSLEPNREVVHYNLGNALRDLERYDQAIDEYRQAIAIRPDYSQALNNLGSTLQHQHEAAQAVVYFERALALQPNVPELLNNLGNALHDCGEYQRAVAHFNSALALKPDYIEVYSNMAKTLEQLGRYDEAIEACRRVIAEKPEFAMAHFNLGICLLLKGEFEEGWGEYAWRWKIKDSSLPRHKFTQPLWDGGSLEGKSILLHAEQGFGDMLQFARYLPMVKKQGTRIMLACESELRRLLENQFQIDQWLSPKQPFPLTDVHCPLMDLPMMFGTTLATVPADIPYLRADETSSTQWAKRLAEYPGLKVGLNWAGRPSHGNDRNRSIALSALAPLFGVPGITFFSLQKWNANPVINTSFNLIDWTQELTDFADTAALINNLDLVISVDTAVVHLAGTMGKPVWTLLPFAPDWRWMLGREDSPWYPTMRLFRQTKERNWDGPIARLVEALHQFAKANP
ncbi:MAG: tetratricopeptide repeat protein [Planctomycetota bacterium]|nr:tetratricopeptide repeat protein [Planctomycetota bacterium]